MAPSLLISGIFLSYLALHTTHCTECTIHCIVYTVQCILYTVHCILYRIHCIFSITDSHCFTYWRRPIVSTLHFDYWITALYYTEPYYTAPRYTTAYYTALNCTALSSLHCTVLTTLHCTLNAALLIWFWFPSVLISSRGGEARWYSAVQCSAVQCSAVQCSAVQCSAVERWWLPHNFRYTSLPLTTENRVVSATLFSTPATTLRNTRETIINLNLKSYGYLSCEVRLNLVLGLSEVPYGDKNITGKKCCSN